jgi:hypothetical protein
MYVLSLIIEQYFVQCLESGFALNLLLDTYPDQVLDRAAEKIGAKIRNLL